MPRRKKDALPERSRGSDWRMASKQRRQLGHSTTRMTEDYSREAEREVAWQAVEQSG